MYKKLIFFMVLVISISFFAGCAKVLPDNSTAQTVNKAPKTASPQQQTAKPPEEKEDPVKEQIAGMTLDEKIGQMVLVGFDGYESNEYSKQMIEKYHVGGFILFKPNIENSNQLLSLLNSLKTTNSANKVPLFLSVDEEGGRVSRMPDEFVKFPTNKRIGQVNNSNFSFNIGSLIGEELKAFGFNVDFAPVLDINSNPKNPVIGDRSFGANSDIVTKLGVQTMKGIQSQNIISVVKHFPGHGDTSVDSHIGLPVVDNDLKRLESFELLPFADAIRNNADAVMIAHILLPKIDSVSPASMSKTIITDVLRKDLKFGGVVFTDDMTMGAIADNFGMGEAAVRSINAGTDIILVCHYNEKEIEVINAIKNAAKTGIVPMERIDESVYRILTLKQKHGLTDKAIGSIDVKSLNNKITALLNMNR